MSRDLHGTRTRAHETSASQAERTGSAKALRLQWAWCEQGREAGNVVQEGLHGAGGPCGCSNAMMSCFILSDTGPRGCFEKRMERALA